MQFLTPLQEGTHHKFSHLGFHNQNRFTCTNYFSQWSTCSEPSTLNSLSIVGQVTFNNGSFINATVTIMRPINLNGSIIMCNKDMLTLNIRTGKFLVSSTET